MLRAEDAIPSDSESPTPSFPNISDLLNADMDERDDEDVDSPPSGPQTPRRGGIPLGLTLPDEIKGTEAEGTEAMRPGQATLQEIMQVASPQRRRRALAEGLAQSTAIEEPSFPPMPQLHTEEDSVGTGQATSSVCCGPDGVVAGLAGTSAPSTGETFAQTPSDPVPATLLDESQENESGDDEDDPRLSAFLEEPSSAKSSDYDDLESLMRESPSPRPSTLPSYMPSRVETGTSGDVSSSLLNASSELPEPPPAYTAHDAQAWANRVNPQVGINEWYRHDQASMRGARPVVPPLDMRRVRHDISMESTGHPEVLPRADLTPLRELEPGQQQPDDHSEMHTPEMRSQRHRIREARPPLTPHRAEHLPPSNAIPAAPERPAHEVPVGGGNSLPFFQASHVLPHTVIDIGRPVDNDRRQSLAPRTPIPQRPPRRSGTNFISVPDEALSHGSIDEDDVLRGMNNLPRRIQPPQPHPLPSAGPPPHVAHAGHLPSGLTNAFDSVDMPRWPAAPPQSWSRGHPAPMPSATLGVPSSAVPMPSSHVGIGVASLLQEGEEVAAETDARQPGATSLDVLRTEGRMASGGGNLPGVTSSTQGLATEGDLLSRTPASVVSQGMIPDNRAVQQPTTLASEGEMRLPQGALVRPTVAPPPNLVGAGREQQRPIPTHAPGVGTASSLLEDFEAMEGEEGNVPSPAVNALRTDGEMMDARRIIPGHAPQQRLPSEGVIPTNPIGRQPGVAELGIGGQMLRVPAPPLPGQGPVQPSQSAPSQQMNGPMNPPQQLPSQGVLPPQTMQLPQQAGHMWQQDPSNLGPMQPPQGTVQWPPQGVIPGQLWRQDPSGLGPMYPPQGATQLPPPGPLQPPAGHMWQPSGYAPQSSNLPGMTPTFGPMGQRVPVRCEGRLPPKEQFTNFGGHQMPPQSFGLGNLRDGGGVPMAGGAPQLMQPARIGSAPPRVDDYQGPISRNHLGPTAPLHLAPRMTEGRMTAATMGRDTHAFPQHGARQQNGHGPLPPALQQPPASQQPNGLQQQEPPSNFSGNGLQQVPGRIVPPAEQHPGNGGQGGSLVGSGVSQPSATVLPTAQRPSGEVQANGSQQHPGTHGQPLIPSSVVQPVEQPPGNGGQGGSLVGSGVSQPSATVLPTAQRPSGEVQANGSQKHPGTHGQPSIPNTVVQPVEQPPGNGGQGGSLVGSGVSQPSVTVLPGVHRPSSEVEANGSQAHLGTDGRQPPIPSIVEQPVEQPPSDVAIEEPTVGPGGDDHPAWSGEDLQADVTGEHLPSTPKGSHRSPAPEEIHTNSDRESPVVAPPEMTDQGQQTTPDKFQIAPSSKRRRVQRETQKIRQDKVIELIEVPLESLTFGAPPTRSMRKRMRVLNFWENERPVMERKPGSVQPTICSVMIARRETDPEGNLEHIPLPPSDFAPLALDPGEEKASHAGSVCDSPASTNSTLVTTPPPRRARRGGVAIGRGRGGEAQRSAHGASGIRRSSGRSGARQRSVALERKRKAPSPVRAPSPVGRDPSPIRAPSPFMPLAEDGDLEMTPVKVGREEEYQDSEFVEGSRHCCRIRVGRKTDYWLACDVIVPPRSVNAAEGLGEHQSLLVTVFGDGQKSLWVSLDGERIGLYQGDTLAVRAGSEYQFGNDSEVHSAHLKLVLVSQP